MRSCRQCGLRFEAGDAFCPADGSAILDSDDELLGATVGSYRVVRMIGEGGMGRVYLGLHPGIGSRVAIKLLSPLAANDEDMVKRFFVEAQLVNKIHHEGIVNVLDLAHLDDGRPYIIMEYLDGEPMSRTIARGPMPLGVAATFGIEILEALGAAHASGVIHRDLKPDNIFITPKGRVKLLDFGIAKLMPEFQTNVVGPATHTGSLLGTPGYMAPEQVVGAAVSPATDLYAVGAVLYEALTGVMAFSGTTLFELFRRIVSEEPTPPVTRRPELAGPFQALILRALAKKPEERHTSAQEMAAELEQIRGSLSPEHWHALPGGLASDVVIGTEATILAPSEKHSVATVPLKKRSKAPWAIAGLLLVAAGGVALVLLLPGTNSKKREVAISETAVPDARVPVPVVVASATMDAGVIVLAPTAVHKSKPEPTPKVTPIDAGVDAATVTIVAAKRPAQSSIHKAPDFNPKAFDAVAYLPKARKLAKQIYPDAILTEFDISGVAANGKSDLTLANFDATYNFRSPSHSARTLPIGVDEDRPCWVYVEVNQKGVTARIVTWDECKGKRRPNPKCTLEQVWKKSDAIGNPKAKAKALAKITYLWDGWFFDIDALGVTGSIPDDC